MVASGLVEEPLLLSLPVGDRNQVAASEDEAWTKRKKEAAAKVFKKSFRFKVIRGINLFRLKKILFFTPASLKRVSNSDSKKF